MWRWGSHDRLKLDPYGRVSVDASPKTKKASIQKFNREQSQRRRKFEKLCSKYGLKASTVRGRMQTKKDGSPGLTLRQALRTPYRHKHKPNGAQRGWNWEDWKRGG